MTRLMTRYFKIAWTINEGHVLTWWQREMLDKFREAGIEIVEIGWNDPKMLLGTYHTILAFYYPTLSATKDEEYINYVYTIYRNQLVKRVVFYDQYGYITLHGVDKIKDLWYSRPKIYNGLPLGSTKEFEHYNGILYPPMWNVEDDPALDISMANRPILTQTAFEQEPLPAAARLSNTSFLHIKNNKLLPIGDFAYGAMPAYVSKAVDNKNIVTLEEDGFSRRVNFPFPELVDESARKHYLKDIDRVNDMLYTQYSLIKEYADYRRWLAVLIGGLA